MVAIGIDLGTTYSCVSVWRNGCAEVILNGHGNRTTPSFVAFTPTTRLIGEPARSQAPFNPWNTIFGAKRLIGRRYDDIGLQVNLRHYPFKIIDENGKPTILVEYRSVTRKFAPEEISSMIIYNMKEIAEIHLGEKVDKAVITVPAYFNDAQRQATRAAGTIAGLEVLRITNEPTAAVLAYGIDRNFSGERNVLMYDLGGGTFDVSIVTIKEGSVYEVKATAGNTRLGGEDFDNRLVAYFIEDFENKYHIDLNTNAKAVRRLKGASETAKWMLSTANVTTVVLESLCNGIDYRGNVTRADFEEICADLFQGTLLHVTKALLDAKMKASDIHDVILVGGSTRIPRIQSMLTSFFGGRTLLSCLNPDESIACGAAIQAAILSGDGDDKIERVVLIDVVPLSLGVETARGIMYRVIDRNTTIPCRCTKDLTTLEDYQRSMTIEVYEGERTLTKDNNLLGVFDLNGIPPAPRGVPKIDITFEVDADGILTVTARDRSTGATEGIVIKNEHRLNQQEITRMIADAEVFREEDSEQKKRLEARNQLESYVYGVRQAITESDKISDSERDSVVIACQEVIVWLDDNGSCLREDYQRKMTELMNEWASTMNKIYDTSWTRNKRMRGESYRELEQLNLACMQDSEKHLPGPP